MKFSLAGLTLHPFFSVALLLTMPKIGLAQTTDEQNQQGVEVCFAYNSQTEEARQMDCQELRTTPAEPLVDYFSTKMDLDYADGGCLVVYRNANGFGESRRTDGSETRLAAEYWTDDLACTVAYFERKDLLVAGMFR